LAALGARLTTKPRAPVRPGFSRERLRGIGLKHGIAEWISAFAGMTWWDAKAHRAPGGSARARGGGALPALAGDLARHGHVGVGAHPGRPLNLKMARNTSIANLLQLCALTMPVAVDECGMPVGLQSMAGQGRDRFLFAAGLAFE
jgi:hypothetical protein